MIRRTPPAQPPRANKHQKARSVAALMFKAELLAVLENTYPGEGFEHLSKPALTSVCVERLGIREIERYLFEALHARRADRTAAGS